MLQYLQGISTYAPTLGIVGRGILLALSCGLLALGILSVKATNKQTEVREAVIYAVVSTCLSFLFLLTASHAVLELTCHDAGNRYLGPKVMWYFVAWGGVVVATVRPRDGDARFALRVIAATFAFCTVFLTVNAHGKVHEYDWTKAVAVETKTLETKQTDSGEKLLFTVCGDKVVFYSNDGMPITLKFNDLDFIALGKSGDYPKLEKREVRTNWKRVYNGEESVAFKVKSEHYVLILPDYNLIPESCEEMECKKS